MEMLLLAEGIKPIFGGEAKIEPVMVDIDGLADFMRLAGRIDYQGNEAKENESKDVQKHSCLVMVKLMKKLKLEMIFSVVVELREGSEIEPLQKVAILFTHGNDIHAVLIRNGF